MSWTNLGTLTLSYEWQVFDLPSVSSSVFRLTQPNLGTVDGSFLIRPYYAGAGAGGSRRFYPSSEDKLIEFRFLSSESGNFPYVRYFQAKLDYQARIFAGESWQIKLEQLL